MNRFVFAAQILALLAVFVQTSDVSPPARDVYGLHDACKTAIQAQINVELGASLVYMNMAAHFGHPDVARRGFAKFFRDSSDEEKKHAEMLIDYLNKRGARVGALTVESPTKAAWTSGRDALEEAIVLEKAVFAKLYHVHHVAEQSCRDPHLMDFLEQPFFEEQVESIGQLNRLVAILRAMDDQGMGEFHVDRLMLKGEITPDHL